MQQTNIIKSISIVGLGNVGWNLAIALRDAGYEIKNIVSRNPLSAKAIEDIIDTSIISDINQITEEPDLYLLAVQDSELKSVAASLSGTGQIVAHTAAGIDMSVFSDKINGFGVFYPFQTFTQGTDMLYSDIPFLLEADSEETLDALKEVAERISGKYSFAGAEERLSLHLAAVFACNFGNHMVTIADYLLNKNNLDLKLLLPLLKQTLKKLDTLSPKEAQTGPAIRNDLITMSKHLKLLADEPELKDIYEALSESIQNKKL